MSVTDNRITETQLNDLLCLAGQMQQKAESVDDRDTAVMAYAVQTACTELSELRCEHAAAMNTITAFIEILGTSDELSISGQVSALLAQRDALAAENAGLKSKLMFWDAESPEAPYDTPEEIAEAWSLNYDEEIEVQVAARLPNRVYRVCESWDQQCKLELVEGAEVHIPATDAFWAEVRASGVDEMAAAYRKFANEDGCSCNMRSSYNLTAERAESYAAYIRQGAAL